jgi:hypothetical protein
MVKLEEYTEHIKRQAENVEIHHYFTHTESLNGHTITFHFADVSHYRVLFWDSPTLQHESCTCKGFYFNQRCKHTYKLRKKVSEETTTKEASPTNNKENTQ